MHDGDSPEETWDVFLSFATADQHHAEELKERLEGQGWKVFLAHKSVRHGTQWRKLIPTALGNSRLVAVLLSSQTDQSPYQDGEIIRAIRAKKSGEVELVPIYLEGEPDSLPSWGFGLEGYQSLDLSRLSMREIAQRLGDQLEDLEPPMEADSGALRGSESLDEGERQAWWSLVGGVVVGILALLVVIWGASGLWLADRSANQQEPLSMLGEEEPSEEMGLAEEGESTGGITAEGEETLEEIRSKEPETVAVEKSEPPAAAGPDPREEETDDENAVGAEEQPTMVRDDEIAKITERQEAPKPRADPKEPRPEMIRILGGTFEMRGHSVTVASFEISKTEVTVAQYRICVEEGDCVEPRQGEFCNWGVAGKDNHPVNCVSWNAAKAYAEWFEARLPSEAEWEYAARSGGLDRDYPWGDTEPTCDLAVIQGCSSGTQPVCSAVDGNTAQGLCDMAGNVWEWVEDDWSSSSVGAPEDGSAWVDSPRASLRVRRGGSWRVFPLFARVAFRPWGVPSGRSDDLGFRVARSLPSSL